MFPPNFIHPAAVHVAGRNVQRRRLEPLVDKLCRVVFLKPLQNRLVGQHLVLDGEFVRAADLFKHHAVVAGRHSAVPQHVAVLLEVAVPPPLVGGVRGRDAVEDPGLLQFRGGPVGAAYRTKTPRP